MCNDATPGGYYWRPSPSRASSALWLVFLESGWWCYDQASCSGRSSAQTSSSTYPAQVDMQGIFNSTDPRLADANLAYVKYCSSDAYVGAQDGPICGSSFNGGFHGAAIVASTWADMSASHGMGTGSQTNVLFAGFSAGGRGTLFNCDRIEANLQASIGASTALNYACFMDSAMWIDALPYHYYSTTDLTAANKTALAYVLFNAQATIAVNSPGCLAANAAQPFRCIFGEYAIRSLLTTRWYLNTYLYDSYQLGSLNNIASPPWSTGQNAYAEAFRATMEGTLRAVVPLDANHGDFSAACYSHGNTLSDKFRWQVVLGATLEHSLMSWYYQDETSPRTSIDNFLGGNGNPYCAVANPVTPLTVSVDAAALPLNVVDSQWLGVNIDSGSLYHGMTFTDPVYRNLAAALAPASLRIGGGATNALLFDPDGPYGAEPNIFPSGLNGQVTNVNAAVFRDITSFAASAGLSLLWDMNGFAFRTNVTWGSYNASGNIPPQDKTCGACVHNPLFDVDNGNLTALLDLMQAENLCVDTVSVGNEPDLYYRYGVALDGTTLAKDLLSIKARLSSYPGLVGLKLSGPSWSGLNTSDAVAYLKTMAGAGPYMLTTHDYPIANS